MCVRGIDVTSFYDFSITFKYCSDSEVFFSSIYKILHYVVIRQNRKKEKKRPNYLIVLFIFST